MYILFEGIDRVGKSTQIELLRGYFDDAIVTKEPGGTPLGLQIRTLLLHEAQPSPLAELFLFLADRAEHFAQVIIPNRHRTILSDRGYISGIAYAYTKGVLDLAQLTRLNEIAMQGIKPDRIVFFEISRQELEARIDNFSQDNIEKRGLDYLLEVQDIMKKLVISSKIAYLIIDASQDRESITKKIVRFIKDGDGD